jgi:hypothetical protein
MVELDYINGIESDDDTEENSVINIGTWDLLESRSVDSSGAINRQNLGNEDSGCNESRTPGTRAILPKGNNVIYKE